MPDPRPASPLYWPIATLRAAYARGDLTPVEVLDESLRRLAALDRRLHAFLSVLEPLAREQAADAANAYRHGTAAPLAGIPISIKDTFDVADSITTRGSLVYRARTAEVDCGVVRRLRGAGAVFVGKTNTAEFGQSATTDNRLGEECRNPWDLRCTSGGSSGGAAASVAAGIVVAGLGADGGGSIRIPAAFSGLVGVKPTMGACPDENGFKAMSEFCSPGPLVWRVADARLMLEVLMGRPLQRRSRMPRLRIAWCPRPEHRPIDAGVAAVVATAAHRLALLPHDGEEVDLPLAGWNDAFAPLVLEEEGRERGHLLGRHRDLLTSYEIAALEAAKALGSQDVERARRRHREYREAVAALFRTYDVILTPTTSVTAFPIGERPRRIAGEKVDTLWGAFPFTAAFNVAGVPAASLPCGLVEGRPVGVQLVCASGRDDLLLDVADQLEQALKFDTSRIIAHYAQVDGSPAPEAVP
ncbi:MAG: amidase [Hyphomicrobiales bacterium]|nr:amidase [Hyphomicrobiales bacterium]